MLKLWTYYANSSTNYNIFPISKYYKAISKLEQSKSSFSAPEGLSFEHFLPWIWKLVLVYQDPDNNNGEQMLPQGTSFSKGYYTKKVN